MAGKKSWTGGVPVFLDAFSHPYKRVRPSVGRSVRPSQASWISDISTEMKQKSTKNMLPSHLKDIKARIEQKSINNIKLPFEGLFKGLKTSMRADRQNASYVCSPSDLFCLDAPLHLH